MKILLISLLSFLSIHCCLAKHSEGILIEAESFKSPGGWVIDQQSMDVMGSPYLMAHGMGIPVSDASTTVSFPKKEATSFFRGWQIKPARNPVHLRGKSLLAISCPFLNQHHLPTYRKTPWFSITSWHNSILSRRQLSKCYLKLSVHF